MREHNFPWMSLSLDAVAIGLEAQSVIGLRMVKAAWGGDDAYEEADLMVSEKTEAALDAHLVIAQSLFAGEAHLGPGRAMKLYRRRVEANRRRLTSAV